MQPCLTPFPILNQSVVLCPVLTVASCPAYRFIRRQIRWFGFPISFNFPQFTVIHTIKGFYIVNEAQVYVFLEFPCFLYDSGDVCNFISGSCAFSKPCLYIWKFSVHVLLKPSLKNFEHNLTGVWKWGQLYSCLNILGHCPSLGLEWKLTFSCPVAIAEFLNLLTYWMQHFNNIIFYDF